MNVRSLLCFFFALTLTGCYTTPPLSKELPPGVVEGGMVIRRQQNPEDRAAQQAEILKKQDKQIQRIDRESEDAVRQQYYNNLLNEFE